MTINTAEIEARLAKATPGPYIRSGVRKKLHDEDCIMVGPDKFLILALPIGRRPEEHAGAFKDADFFAHAWTDIRDLLAALKAETARAEKADLLLHDTRGAFDAIRRELTAANEPGPCDCGYEDLRLEGIRLGLEAAAKWHDDRRDENDTVSDNSAEGKLVRVNARVWANEHDRMATAIRAITPSDVLKKGKS